MGSMNTISRTITGITAIILGLYLIILSFSSIWILGYGIPFLVIGFYILFNKKEDEIEKVRGT